jgi:hypothetical protein
MPIYRFQAWRGWLGAEAEPLLMPQRSYQIARLMIIHNAAATKHPIMMRVSQAPRLRSGSSGGSDRSLLLILDDPRSKSRRLKKATPPPGSGGVEGFRRQKLTQNPSHA